MNSDQLWDYTRTTVLLYTQETHLIWQIGQAQLYLDSLIWADEPDKVEIAAVTCRLELYHQALINVWTCLGADLEAEGAELNPVDLLWTIMSMSELNSSNNLLSNTKHISTSANRNSKLRSVSYKNLSMTLTISLPTLCMMKTSSTPNSLNT
jgi:hypothetical protein